MLIATPVIAKPPSSKFWFCIVDDVQPVKIDEIKRAICAHFGITSEYLLSPGREYECVYPRQVGMYLARQLSTKGFAEIARRFNRTDHSTVRSACRKVRRLIQADRLVAREIAQIKEMLV